MAKRNQKLPTLPAHLSLIDTHCHLDMSSYANDLDDILQRAFLHGVRSAITIGIDVASSFAAVRLAKKYTMLKATVGIHPHDAESCQKEDLDTLSNLIDSNRDVIVGYGEIGLDYVKKYSPREVQLNCFADQIALAKNHDLPIVIHDREAHDDIISLLKKAGPIENGGIMHCFSGNVDFANRVLDLGFHISIPGIVTFKNAHELKKVAQHIPLNRLLVETDGPFLAPSPYRGKRNEPLYLLFTAEEVARLRGLSLEQIATATTANCLDLFNMPMPWFSIDD